MFAVRSNKTTKASSDTASSTRANGNSGKEKDDKEDNAPEAVSTTVKATKPTTLKLNGVPVHFPFKPYKLQEDYMSKVIVALENSENALIESPTGTGKSLCLLCSSLAWQKHRSGKQSASVSKTVSISANLPKDKKENESKSKKSTIIYASRTHSQLSQVVGELKNTRYRPKYALLASRDQFCINEKLTNSKTSININHSCSQLTKKRQCFYRNNLEHFTPPRTDGEGKRQPIMDIEELTAMGKKHRVCPFYYSRNATEDAELILMPYNYLFDRDFRKATNINWKDAIVIFDEAHNLESFASDASSFDLTSVDIGGSILEIQKAIGIVTNGFSSMEDNSMSGTNLIKLKTIFLSLEEVLNSVSPSGGSFAGDYIFEFLQRAQINYSNHDLLLQFIRSVSDLILESRGGTTSGTPKLDHFASCIKKVFSGSDQAQCIAKSRVYRVHVSPKMSTSGGKSNMGQMSGRKERTLSYWCFAPSLAMNDLNNLGLRSIIVTSGTLSPMSSYSLELGLKFNVQLENPHIIKSNQVHVRVMGRGVSNKELKSTYDRRDDKEYLLEMGNTLCALAKIVPGGMLVFFPSYGVMDKCIEAWGGPSKQSTWLGDNAGKNTFFSKRKTKSVSGGSCGKTRYSFPRAPNYYGTSNINPWQRMLSHKSLVLEPKSTSEMRDAIDEFDKYINTKSGNGCILMGVTRGKISEGIDFANGRARAVIITGLPFPPLYNQKVKLKREFLDGMKASASIRPTGVGGFDGTSLASQRQLTMSGSEWYSQQAHRAINQAVGRVIRHRFDYGAIILMDSRFSDSRNQEGLSKWVRPAVQPDEGIGKAISGLALFYKEAETDPDLAGAPLSTDTVYRKIEAINLEYETEKQDRNLQIKEIEKEKIPTEIAIVKDCSDNGDSFVKPDQIIERIVVKNGHKYKALKTLEAQETIVKESGLSDVYKRPLSKSSSKVAFTSFGGRRSVTLPESAWNIENQTNPKVKSSKVFNRASNLSLSTTSATGDKSSNSQRTSAIKFFRYAKEKLTPDDFQNARSLITNMRAFGDKNDSKSYMDAAKDLVILLIKYDNDDDSRNLLSLLFPLLPTRHRGSIQTMATSTRAKKSKKVSDALMNRKAEDKVQSVLFKKSTLEFKIKQESMDIQSDEGILDSKMNENEKRNALVIASELRASNQKKVKEFMSDRRSDNCAVSSGNRSFDSVIQNRMDSQVSEKGLKRSSARALSMVSTKNRIQGTTQEDDPILKTLQMAQSSSYHTQKVASIKSNVPSKLLCQICQTRTKRPLLASCGHSACASCWDSWLSRNEQCPVCRKETKRENLAHMVFQQANEEVPTLSQICCDDNEADGSESSGDELELTYGK